MELWIGLERTQLPSPNGMDDGYEKSRYPEVYPAYCICKFLSSMASLGLALADLGFSHCTLCINAVLTDSCTSSSKMKFIDITPDALQ